MIIDTRKKKKKKKGAGLQTADVSECRLLLLEVVVRCG